MVQLNLNQSFAATDGNPQETNESNNPSQVRRQRRSYLILLAIVLFISFIFQAGNLGWIKIILGLIYVVTFSLHAGYWFVWLGRPGHISRFDKATFALTNLFFLIGNVLNLDFGDVSSYMFFMQYTDPPESLIAAGFISYIAWFAILLLEILVRVALRSRKK